MMTAGPITLIFTRPLSLLFLLIAVVMLVWPLYGERKRRRDGAQATDPSLE